MQVQQHSDGWHLVNEDGKDCGCFTSLSQASERLDWLENQARLQRESTPEPALSGTLWQRWRHSVARFFRANEQGSMSNPPPRVHHWSSPSGR